MAEIELLALEDSQTLCILLPDRQDKRTSPNIETCNRIKQCNAEKTLPHVAPPAGRCDQAEEIKKSFHERVKDEMSKVLLGDTPNHQDAEQTLLMNTSKSLLQDTPFDGQIPGVKESSSHDQLKVDRKSIFRPDGKPHSRSTRGAVKFKQYELFLLWMTAFFLLEGNLPSAFADDNFRYEPALKEVVEFGGSATIRKGLNEDSTIRIHTYEEGVGGSCKISEFDPKSDCSYHRRAFVGDCDGFSLVNDTLTKENVTSSALVCVKVAASDLPAQLILEVFIELKKRSGFTYSPVRVKGVDYGGSTDIVQIADESSNVTIYTLEKKEKGKEVSCSVDVLDPGSGCSFYQGVFQGNCSGLVSEDGILRKENVTASALVCVEVHSADNHMIEQVSIDVNTQSGPVVGYVSVGWRFTSLALILVIFILGSIIIWLIFKVRENKAKISKKEVSEDKSELERCTPTN